MLQGELVCSLSLQRSEELTWRLERSPAFGYTLLNIEMMEGVGKFAMSFEEKGAWERDLLWIFRLYINRMTTKRRPVRKNNILILF